MLDQPRTPRATFGRLVAFLIAAAVLAVGIAARGDSIRLRPHADAAGPDVRLAEVAVLEGESAHRFADVVVAHLPPDLRETRITLDAVRGELTAAGANWGLLSLKGYAACRVHRAGEADGAEAPSAEAAPAAPAALAHANPEAELTVGSPVTLRDVVLQKLVARTGASAHDLRITFDDRDAAVLARRLGADRYEVQPIAAAAIGRVPVTLRRYRDGRAGETVTVTAQVERRCLALVATRGIGRGDHFTSDSVAVREVYLRDERGEPVADPSLVVGQVAAAQLREGAVVYPTAVQPPLLVRRGELVTVRCVSGGLVIRTVARAAAEGALDDRIEVRNESTRQSYVATVTGPREATVDLSGAPVAVAPAANQKELGE